MKEPVPFLTAVQRLYRYIPLEDAPLLDFIVLEVPAPLFDDVREWLNNTATVVSADYRAIPHDVTELRACGLLIRRKDARA